MADPLADIDIDHEQAVVNGVRLHYVTAGPEDGNLVVPLHGFPEFWYSWRFQIPALVDAGYRVLAPDLRGYNTSEKPHGVDAYRLAELTRDVVGLIEHAGRDWAHVVGHDWGGVVAWSLGARHPDVLDRLVVLNAPHPAAIGKATTAPRQILRSWYVFFFQLPWLPERLLSAGDFRAIREGFAEESNNPDAFSERDIDRYVEAMSHPGALTAGVNYYRAFFRNEFRDAVTAQVPIAGRNVTPADDRPIDAETLLLWGEDDRALGVELTEGLDPWVPRLRVERFADASHWVQCDVPGKVNEELRRFLGE